METPTFRLEYEKRGHDILARLFVAHDGTAPQFVSRFTLPAWVFYLLVQALQVGSTCMTPRIEMTFVPLEGAAAPAEVGRAG